MASWSGLILPPDFSLRGVHGPSEIIDPRFPWEDDSWNGLPLSKYLLYELHVGAFTPDGTFKAIIPYLDYLLNLGITAVEIMPVAQFPGSRNWGYDGVYPYAAQNSYGGPDALKRLINACHLRGMAVVLDVVYNHLGPEGNYLWDFGPYFTDKYKTPWGPAINLDGPFSDEVRKFFIENALHWVTDFHIDALRVDAVHGMLDFSARHFLEELADVVHEQGERLARRVYVMSEGDLNDSRIIRSRDVGGYGLDAQWNDDFHHALHALLTHERSGYYGDFGELRHMIKALRDGFVYSGEYSAYRKRRHGNQSADLPARRFVVFCQNHDQVGNCAMGARLTQLVTMEGLKLAAGTVLLSPFIPLLFMGEEYGETSPFPYFVSHSDQSLVEAVRKGRREEFKAFEWPGEPPDPQAESTFMSAKVDHSLEERLEDVERPIWVPLDLQFHFIRSQIVVFDTSSRIERPEDLRYAVSKMPVGCIFYHFIDARRRTSIGLDDFRAWLEGFGDTYEELRGLLASVDPYFVTLKELRGQLAGIFGGYFGGMDV